MGKNTLPAQLSKALQFATLKHGLQTRKGTEILYISHPLAVAALVMEHSGNLTQIQAALFHDLCEDCDVSLAVIKKQFGAGVAKIVENCSDSFSSEKGPWKNRKVAYLKHLETVSADTLLVSLADKVHNCGAIVRDLDRHGKGVWKRFSAEPLQISWYYSTLLKIFTRRRTEGTAGFKQLLADFRKSVKRLVAEAKLGVAQND
ncbi:HD domain-containing protein [Bdellovibrionota bacterium FG-1]